MNIPSVGSTIRVEVKNYSATLMNPLLKDSTPLTHTFEGTVVRNSSFDEPNTFCLTTDNPKFPIRNIAMRSVVRIDGSSVEYKDQTDTRVVMVKGSKGNEYTVVINGDKATCTCPQNQYRRQVCKHIKQVLGIN